jgi:hypothetical protein
VFLATDKDKYYLKGANIYIKNYKLNPEDIVSIEQLNAAPKNSQKPHWSDEYSFII